MRLWDENQLPTPQQRLWGNMFLALWDLVDHEGRGAGKTWFWRHVIDFIELQDPWVRPEPKPLIQPGENP